MPEEESRSNIGFAKWAPGWFRRSSSGEFELPSHFTDVLYLTNQGKVPPEIKRLFKQKSIQYAVISFDKFPQILHRVELIGTVIIDAKDLKVSEQQKLARIIESLEMCNIGVILLNNRMKLPVRSFSLAGPQVKSFSMTSRMESVSLDELWVRISVNLAYRKRGSEISVRPPVPPIQLESNHTNQLAEKLRMTGSLVDTIAEQLRMAGMVQRDFLPSRLPDSGKLRWSATFLPAEWVSGDIYDATRLDEEHIGFYIADAVGHAMPAALLTIFVKQALVMRETIGDDYRIFSPSDVMKNLNIRIAAQKLSGYQFATCCYCLLNTKTLELTYSRGGHPYPILIRPGLGPQRLETDGPLLGIFERSEYEQQTIQLREGDKVFLYSDGAEPFIGGFDDIRGFDFSDEFRKLSELPMVEMMDDLNQLIIKHKLAPSEIDDITAVGMEIL